MSASQSDESGDRIPVKIWRTEVVFECSARPDGAPECGAPAVYAVGSLPICEEHLRWLCEMSGIDFPEELTHA